MTYIVENVVASSKPSKIVRYELSDVDLTITPIHMPVYLFYPLSSETVQERIQSALKIGLANSLTRLPLFAGRLHLDIETKRPVVLHHPDDTCELGIRHLDESHPSFAMLESHFFPPSMLDRSLLIPAMPTFDPEAEQSVPLWYCQASFVRGGLIFAAAFHHAVADAWTCHRFLGLFAQHTRLVLHGHPDRLVDFEVNADRSPFQAAGLLSSNQTEEAEQQLLHDHLPTFLGLSSDALEAAIARITPGTEVSGMLLHIPSPDSARLKARCAVPEPDFVSTYDCIAALIWRVVTRARLATGIVTKTDKTTSSHTMNQRSRMPGANTTYIGNASTKVVTSAITVAELLADGGLAAAALRGRRAIRACEPDRLQRLADVFHVLGKPRVKALDRAASRTGVVITSWQQMQGFSDAESKKNDGAALAQPNEANQPRSTQDHSKAAGPTSAGAAPSQSKAMYDFGFGAPVAFRSPGVPLDGGVIVFPTPPGGGAAVWVGAARACVEAMQKDEELLEYAQVKGVERVGG